MIDDTRNAPDDAATDAELAKELDGVPDKFREEGVEEGASAADASLEEALAGLRGDLEAAKQEVLYARADTQNLRRRMEKDVQDARNYAATGFARDVLSVSDNLARAIDAIPAELHDDERMKVFVTGIEATQRELEKVFGQHGIKRIAAVGLPLDPNLHQAMMEVPAPEGKEAGTVVAELQPGYTINDRLLRPVMVTVAK